MPPKGRRILKFYASQMRRSEHSASIKASSAILQKLSGITVDLTDDEASSGRPQTSSAAQSSKILLNSIHIHLRTLATLSKNVEGLSKTASDFEIWVKNFPDESGCLHEWLATLKKELKLCHVSNSFMTEFLELSNQTAKDLGQLTLDKKKKEKISIGKRVTASSKVRWEMDDEMLYSQFQTTVEVIGDEPFESTLFFNHRHQEKYEKMLKRGVMPHRPVDFDFLKYHGIKVQSFFEEPQWLNFCTKSAPVYPALVAYFYSSLHFPLKDRLSFYIHKELHDVSATQLAKILGVPLTPFQTILGNLEEDYAFLRDNSSLEEDKHQYLQYSQMSLKYQMVYRILTHCIRPKASSHFDVAEYEAKICAAIIRGKEMSLPYMVIIHMYRSLYKSKGTLPYEALITQLFLSKKVNLPIELIKETVAPRPIGPVMFSKTLLKATPKGWKNNQGDLLKFEGSNEKECLSILKQTLKNQATTSTRVQKRKTMPADSRTSSTDKETLSKKKKQGTKQKDKKKSSVQELLDDQEVFLTPLFSPSITREAIRTKPYAETPLEPQTAVHSFEGSKNMDPVTRTEKEKSRDETPTRISPNNKDEADFSHESPAPIISESKEVMTDSPARKSLNDESQEDTGLEAAEASAKEKRKGKMVDEQPAHAQGELGSVISELIMDIHAFDDSIISLSQQHQMLLRRLETALTQGEPSPSPMPAPPSIREMVQGIEDQGNRITTLERTMHQLLTRLNTIPHLSLINTPTPFFPPSTSSDTPAPLEPPL